MPVFRFRGHGRFIIVFLRGGGGRPAFLSLMMRAGWAVFRGRGVGWHFRGAAIHQVLIGQSAHRIHQNLGVGAFGIHFSLYQ
ncbi:hypothetical protein SDC9_118068 [bioreactor metagenome]|uniref:Uncharacterized protein n=1 Tax=bioreactor metagenome TaxID=1076179 RepID=A0A645C0P0_9ZZZZ